MAHPWRNVPQRLNAKRKVCATAALVEGCASCTINANAIYTQTGAQSLKNNASVAGQTIAAHIKIDTTAAFGRARRTAEFPSEKMLALRFEACSALALNNRSELRNDIWS